MPMRPTLLSRFALALCGVAAVGCGDDESAGGRSKGTGGPVVPSVDRSSPEVVLAAAHRALVAGDYAGLEPYMTPSGLARVSRDLVAWRTIAADSGAAASGAHVAPRVRLPDDPASRDAALAALSGDDPRALLRAYVAIEPRVALPPAVPAARDPGVDRAELTMPAAGGETRLVRFVRGTDGWRIDRLQL